MSNYVGPLQPDTSDLTAAVEFLRRERAQESVTVLDSPEWLTKNDLKARGYRRINDPRQQPCDC